jgi:hypothetical protein
MQIKWEKNGEVLTAEFHDYILVFHMKEILPNIEELPLKTQKIFSNGLKLYLRNTFERNPHTFAEKMTEKFHRLQRPF